MPDLLVELRKESGLEGKGLSCLCRMKMLIHAVNAISIKSL